MAMYKLIFYVPETHLNEVKSAVFAAGAGKLGNYDCCSWEVLGTGQFRPGAGSQPFLGQQDKIETVAEYRVETLCAAEFIEAAVSALKTAHPYEEPAFDVIKCEIF